MKIVHFDQSSESWLEWRTNGVGASDIGVIMGVDPYKKAPRLWKEKCGLVNIPKSTGPMLHGHRNEPKARLEFDLLYGTHLEPLCVEDPHQDWMRASLDGLDRSEGILVEIKCPVKAEKIAALIDTHELPLNWEYQLQWQMGIVKSKKTFFALWDYRDETLYAWEIEFNPDTFSIIQEKASEFWTHVRKGLPLTT